MPVKIKDISASLVRELLDYNPTTGDFVWKKSRGRTAKKGMIAGCVNEDYYIRIMINGTSYYAQRLAWAYMYGDLNGDVEIDHKNLIHNDNRISNLRIASHSNNQANQDKARNNTSGVKGVTYRKGWGKWRVRVGINKRRVHVGDFATLDEAKCAYYSAAVNLHAEFARAA